MRSSASRLDQEDLQDACRKPVSSQPKSVLSQRKLEEVAADAQEQKGDD